FYTCLVVVVAAVAAPVVVGVVWWRRWTGRAGHPLGVAPHAGFARPRDLKRLTVPAPQPGRVTIGRAGHRLLACEPQASLAVFGPTGAGKTIGFAAPALLEWEGPVIATSVKADLLSATLEHRQARGKVWIYDPSGAAGLPPGQTAGWSPVPACATWAGALRIAAWLAEAAQPRLDTVADGDYWYTQGRKGLAPYLHAAALGGKKMRDVVRWVDTQDDAEAAAILTRHAGVEDRVSALLDSDEGRRRREVAAAALKDEVIDAVKRELLDRPGGRPLAARPYATWPERLRLEVDNRVADEAEGRVRTEVEAEIAATLAASEALAPLHAARSLWRKEERLRDSVFATIENILYGYADPAVLAAADQPTIDLAQWLTGDHTIHVIANPHEQNRLRPVLTVLVQAAIRAAYDTAAATGRRGRLPHPCLVLLDEAGNIAPLRDLPAYASTGRSYGITLVTLWQDLAQLDALYRDRAQTVLNNHRAKLFGTGIAHTHTLDYVSRLAGDEARLERQISVDLAGGRRSLSEHTAYRPAAPADLVRRIPDNEAVLVYGSLPPVHVRLRPWFADAELRRRAGEAACSDDPDWGGTHA
ncbi:MAG: type IV secretory system conjugative DNA transfer family protein, partial [Actinomycetota bacterium]